MAYGFQGLKSLGLGGEQVQEPLMSLPTKQPAYDPAGYASFAKPSVSDTKGEMSQSPKDAVIAKYGYTPGQMPGINKDVQGVQGTSFNNRDNTTKNEIRSSIAQRSTPKTTKPSVKEEVRKAGYNPHESLGDLVATAIDNGGALSDEQIAQYFPEFKGKEKVIGDYFATLNEKPDLTPEETQQYFPEFFDNVQVNEEYKYNIFDYAKRGAERLNKKAENIDIPVVEPIAQGVLGATEFAAKGLRDITQAGASTLDRGIAKATGTERVIDRTVAEDIFDAAQGTWNTALAVYAPRATIGFNSAMQALPVEGQQKIGEVFNDVGSFVGKLPGVKQIKETLPPDRQQEFEQEVVGAMVGLIIGSKNKSNIYKNPLKFFSENLNPKALAKNIQENVVNIPAKAIRSAKVGEKVATSVASAPQKAYEATKKIAEGANEVYARKVTGLSQKAVDTFKSNPTRRNVEAGQLTEDGLMKEVADTIASEKSRLDETGKAYEAVRNKDTVVNVGTQLPDITEKLSKYNISVAPDGKLNFADSALESDVAGQKAIQFAYDVAKRGEIPADIFLNKRLDISNSIDWRSGVSDTANKITKEIRNSLNEAGHRDVAGLGALDETYGPQRKVWNQIAREFIDRETGGLKDSAKSKIMNMTNANKEALLAKIEQYFPDISLKVDALRTAREVDSLKGIKAGTYNKTALVAGGAKAGYELGQKIIPGGGLIGAPLGAIAGFIATDPAYIIKRLKGLEAKVPEEIMKKIELKQNLAKKEAGLVQKAISDAAKQSADRQGLESKFKSYMEGQGKEKPLALPEKSQGYNLGTKKNPIVAKAPEGYVAKPMKDLSTMEKIMATPQDAPKKGYETKLGKVTETTNNGGANPTYRVKVEGSDKRHNIDEIGGVYKPKTEAKMPRQEKTDTPKQEPEGLKVAPGGKKEYYLKLIKEEYGLDINKMDTADMLKVKDAINSRTPAKAEEILKGLQEKYASRGLPQKSVAKVAKKEKASTLEGVTPKKIEMTGLKSKTKVPTASEFTNPVTGKVTDPTKIPENWASMSMVDKTKYTKALDQYNIDNGNIDLISDSSSSIPTKSLEAEARKYKSAEEFVSGNRPSSKDIKIDSVATTPKFSFVRLKGGKNYKEIIHSVNFYTNPGGQHYSKYDYPNYFAHSRLDEVADSTRVLEIQSDLMQSGKYLNRSDTPIRLSELSNEVINADGTNYRIRGIEKKGNDYLIDITKDDGVSENKIIELSKLKQEIKKPIEDIINTTEEGFNNSVQGKLKKQEKDWYEKIIRKTIVDTDTKYVDFPTGETASKVQQYQTIGNKGKSVMSFYDDKIGKYLKSLGAENYIDTDGNSRYRIKTDNQLRQIREEANKGLPEKKFMQEDKMQDLYKEARKYKSADEFIDELGTSINEYDGEGIMANPIGREKARYDKIDILHKMPGDGGRHAKARNIREEANSKGLPTKDKKSTGLKLQGDTQVAAIKYAEDNMENIFSKYEKENGNVINLDDFRQYIDNKGSIAANDTHKAAKILTTEYERRIMSNLKPGDKGAIVGGGSGGGKGTAISQLGIKDKGYSVVFDKVEGSDQIKSMLDKGMSVDYYMVIPDPGKIVSNIVGRAKSGNKPALGEIGRTLPIRSVGLQKHIEAADVFKELQNIEEYKDKVTFYGVDNSGTKEQIKLIDVVDTIKRLEKYSKDVGSIKGHHIRKVAKNVLDSGGITKFQYDNLIKVLAPVLLIFGLGSQEDA